MGKLSIIYYSSYIIMRHLYLTEQRIPIPRKGLMRWFQNGYAKVLTICRQTVSEELHTYCTAYIAILKYGQRITIFILQHIGIRALTELCSTFISSDMRYQLPVVDGNIVPEEHLQVYKLIFVLLLLYCDYYLLLT